MRTTFLCAFFLIFSSTLLAQINITGKWYGPILYKKDGLTLIRGKVTFEFIQKGEQISGVCLIDIDDIGKVKYPFTGTFLDKKIKFVENADGKKKAKGILSPKNFSGEYLEERGEGVNKKWFAGKSEIKGIFTFNDKTAPRVMTTRVFNNETGIVLSPAKDTLSVDSSVFTVTSEILNFPEESINPNEIFKMNNLNFEKNSFDILPNDELDNLLNFLSKNSSFHVHIVGHTDSDGNDDFNTELSFKRANSVKKYLIQNGIASERITTEGVGSKKPISEKKEANRRVEVSFKKQ